MSVRIGILVAMVGVATFITFWSIFVYAVLSDRRRDRPWTHHEVVTGEFDSPDFPA